MNDLLAATPLEPTSSCSMNEAMDNSMTEHVEAFYGAGHLDITTL